MKNFTKVILLIMMGIASFLYVITPFTTRAQPEPLPLRNLSGEEVEIDVKLQIEGYTVIMISNTADAALLDALNLNPQRLEDSFGIITYQDEEAIADILASENTEQSFIDAIIITPSSLKSLEASNFIHNQYLAGSFMVFINVDGEAAATALGVLKCPPNGVYFEKYPDYWYTSYILRVESLLPEEKLAIVSAYNDCGDENDVKIEGAVRLAVGTSADSLMDSRGGSKVLQVIGLNIETLEDLVFTADELALVQKPFGEK